MVLDRYPARLGRRWLECVGVIFACLSGRAAMADETPPERSPPSGKPEAEASDPVPASEEEAVEIVVTGTRTPEQTQRATLATGVVTRREAERRGAMDVAEALAGEPGLQVNPNAYSFLGSPAGVQIQGLDAERVLILRDGERVIGDFGGVIDLSAYSLSDVERIEYVTGPTSSLYGTGALGGVVNIISGPPDTEGPSGRARAEMRSIPAYLAEGAYSHRVQSLWGTLTTSYRASEGTLLFDDRPDLATPNLKRGAAGLRIGHESDDVDSQVFGSWSRERAAGLGSEDVPVLGRFLVDLPETTDRFTARNVERFRLGGGSQLQSSLSAQWFVNRAQRDRRDSPLDERRFRDQSLLSSELTATLADGDRTWVVGVRGEREAFRQRLERVTSAQGELTESERIEVAPVELSSVAGYAQLGWKLHPDLVVMPGVRAELHTRFGHVVAPRLAAAWFATESLRFRASVGTGFRAPSAKEFGFFFDHSSLGYRVLGNDALRPERSLGVNAEATLRATQAVTLRAGGFYNWVSDLIATEFGGREQAGIDDFTYVNVGRARTAGIETSVIISLLPMLRSELSTVYLFTRNDDEGTPLPSRPPYTLVSSLVYSPTADLELYYRQRTVSEAYLSEEVATPGFGMLDLRATYELVSSVSVYAGAMNVLDAQDDPLRVGDQRPVIGRMYVAGVRGAWPEQE